MTGGVVCRDSVSAKKMKVDVDEFDCVTELDDDDTDMEMMMLMAQTTEQQKASHTGSLGTVDDWRHPNTVGPILGSLHSDRKMDDDGICTMMGTNTAAVVVSSLDSDNSGRSVIETSRTWSDSGVKCSTTRCSVTSSNANQRCFAGRDVMGVKHLDVMDMTHSNNSSANGDRHCFGNVAIATNFEFLSSVLRFSCRYCECGLS